jgi:hypothetical protein
MHPGIWESEDFFVRDEGREKEWFGPLIYVESLVYDKELNFSDLSTIKLWLCRIRILYRLDKPGMERHKPEEEPCLRQHLQPQMPLPRDIAYPVALFTSRLVSTFPHVPVRPAAKNSPSRTFRVSGITCPCLSVSTAVCPSPATTSMTLASIGLPTLACWPSQSSNVLPAYPRIHSSRWHNTPRFPISTPVSFVQHKK